MFVTTCSSFHLLTYLLIAMISRFVTCHLIHLSPGTSSSAIGGALTAGGERRGGALEVRGAGPADGGDAAPLRAGGAHGRLSGS